MHVLCKATERKLTAQLERPERSSGGGAVRKSQCHENVGAGGWDARNGHLGYRRSSSGTARCARCMYTLVYVCTHWYIYVHTGVSMYTLVDVCTHW